MPPTPSPRSAAPEEWDVAIIGSGPAGGAAALALAGRGLRIALLEKAALPRYKTCGGGVLWRARRRLPLDVSAVVERECHVAEMVHHGPDLSFSARRSLPIVSMVMRDRFDHLLVHTAAQQGVEMRVATPLLAIVVERDQAQLTTAAGGLRARFVIAADGVNSLVARKLGLPPLRGLAPALECEATFNPELHARYGASARFDFGLVPGGYGWVFPKDGRLSIGVGTTRRGGVNLPHAYARYAARLGLAEPKGEERHGYMIPCLPRERLFSHARVFFAGDAAGLADPVTAEGISAAIISGQLAAQAILAHRDDPARALTAYRRSLQRELLADLRVARWLAWLLYQRPLLCARLLSRHGGGMSELMTRIVMGETTYRGAISRPGHYLRLLLGRRSA